MSQTDAANTENAKTRNEGDVFKVSLGADRFVGSSCGRPLSYVSILSGAAQLSGSVHSRLSFGRNQLWKDRSAEAWREECKGRTVADFRSLPEVQRRP